MIYNKKHGMYKTRIYHIWQNMKKRCQNPNASNYPRYGGRGVSVCEEWNNFRKFYKDMKQGYSDNLSLDRINNNGNYCKENCRWATLQQQSDNSRGKRRKVMFKGKETDFYRLAYENNINPATLRGRVLRRGIPLEDALKIKLNKHYDYK